MHDSGGVGACHKRPELVPLQLLLQITQCTGRRRRNQCWDGHHPRIWQAVAHLPATAFILVPLSTTAKRTTEELKVQNLNAVPKNSINKSWPELHLQARLTVGPHFTRRTFRQAGGGVYQRGGGGRICRRRQECRPPGAIYYHLNGLKENDFMYLLASGWMAVGLLGGFIII